MNIQSQIKIHFFILWEQLLFKDFNAFIAYALCILNIFNPLYFPRQW